MQYSKLVDRMLVCMCVCNTRYMYNAVFCYPLLAHTSICCTQSTITGHSLSGCRCLLVPGAMLATQYKKLGVGREGSRFTGVGFGGIRGGLVGLLEGLVGL